MMAVLLCVSGLLARFVGKPQYDIAPAGRFLSNTVLDSSPAPITLVQNWNPEVRTQ